MLGKIISAGVIVAGTAAAAFIAKKKGTDSFCPECDIKKAIAKATVHIKTEKKYGNNAAMTPPMGWSSWNLFGPNINENLIIEVADAMKKSGLLDAGYCYVNLDDCWQSSLRDENGRLQGDLTAFPSGIKALVKKLNSKGFKAGIYSSNGTLTCEDLPASLGNERIDAETFADWGIEYFKYDFCHSHPITSEAPVIDKIIISSKDKKQEIILEAQNGELDGTAAVISDSKGSYVGRLDSDGGSLKFSFVNVDKSGEYIATVVFRKKSSGEKYAVMTVNGEKEYPFTVPPTRAFSAFGRVQLFIDLEKGNNTIEIKNPVGSKMDGAALQYINMGKELKRATENYAKKHKTEEKPIVYSICEWGFNKPYKWGAQAGNLWRTTLDIKPIWSSVVAIYEHNVKLYEYAGPGGWNDPDMLEVGNGQLTVDENKSHFTLWCMMAAPLIIGNDVRTFISKDGCVDYSNKFLQILTNKDLIDIDQDKRGSQCRRYKTNLFIDILVKPLENNEIAVCFFNKSKGVKKVQVSISELANQGFTGLPDADEYECFDLWSKDTFTAKNLLSAEVKPHGVEVFRIKAK